jgi:hypothetical protein
MNSREKRVKKMEDAAVTAQPVIDEAMTARLRRAYARIGLDWPSDAVAYTSTEKRSLANRIVAAKLVG